MQIDEGYTLFTKISEEFVDDYSRKELEYNTKAINTTGLEKETWQKRKEQVAKIVSRLRDINFKEAVMKENRKQVANFHELLEFKKNTILLFDYTFNRRLRLAGCRLPEPLPFDPAGVVFPMQRITWKWRPFHLCIMLIVHPVKG